jgi:hypothetical protein
MSWWACCGCQEEEEVKVQIKGPLVYNSLLGRSPDEREDAFEQGLNRVVNTGANGLVAAQQQYKHIKRQQTVNKNRKKMEEVRKKYGSTSDMGKPPQLSTSEKKDNRKSYNELRDNYKNYYKASS